LGRPGRHSKKRQLDPRHAGALHNLGTLAERSGQLDAAAHLYEQALAAMPEHRPARFQLGRIYANQQRYAKAIAEFEKLQEPMEAQSATYLYALAATHARAGHRHQSIEILQRARQQAEKFGQREIATAVDRDLALLGVRQ
jgi:tetratricopeptide (TPR) repeat protein